MLCKCHTIFYKEVQHWQMLVFTMGMGVVEYPE